MMTDTPKRTWHADARGRLAQGRIAVGSDLHLLEMALKERDELTGILRVIVELGDKTLIMASDDPHERQAYSLGANRAFGQCAGLARAALGDAA